MLFCVYVCLEMEKIIFNVSVNGFRVDNNLEAAPLVVQLVQEGKQWRLRLPSPVVGLAGSALISSRCMDYALGYYGRGFIHRSSGFSGGFVELEKRRIFSGGAFFMPEQFEHPATASEYFASMGTTELMKDLNLLQLQLRKQPALTAEALQKLLKRQLKKVYWNGFSLRIGKDACFVNEGWKKKLGYDLLEAPTLKETAAAQREWLHEKIPAKRNYTNFLLELYRFPPMYNFYQESYKPDGNKDWAYLEHWGCEALGVIAANRFHFYSKEDKGWYRLDVTVSKTPIELVYPPFYRRSYQRYKENGAICSGYPDWRFCKSDARNEWRKAVDWFPDSVDRKDNGPLKKQLYVGYPYGRLPSKDLGQEPFKIFQELLDDGFNPHYYGVWGWSRDPL